MRRRSRLVAKTPLARKAPLRSSKEKRTARRDTGPDRTTRELVLERDDFACVVCGKPWRGFPWDSIHHRRNRGQGGSSDPAKNRPSNLLTVCGTGTTECHGTLTANERREENLDAGYVVSLNSTDEPADVPVQHRIYGLVYLLDDGTVTPVPHLEAS